MKKLMFICIFVFVLTIVATPSLAEKVIITAEDKGINWIPAEPIELYSYTGYNTFILPNPNPPPDEFEYEIEFDNLEMAIHATGSFVHCWNVIYAIVPDEDPVEEDEYIWIVDIFSEGDEDGFLHGVDEDFDLSETTIFGNTQVWTATPFVVDDLTVYLADADLSPFGETTGRFFVSEFYLPYGEVHKPPATITGTSVSVGMRIDVNGVTDVIGTNTGTTYASVDLISPSTGAQVSSMLNINSLSSEAANLNFKLSLDGTSLPASVPGNNYLGESSEGSNHAEIFCHANIDFAMGFSWNFDYIGPEPFGLGPIYVKVNGSITAELGNFGIIGHYWGSNTFDLLAGNDYTIQTMFNPHVEGVALDSRICDGTLTGDISFSFVPEPPETTTTTTAEEPPTTDAYEPDNFPADATPIADGQAQSHTIHTDGDVDWLAVTLQTGYVLTVGTSNLSGSNPDTVLELYDNNCTALAYDDDSGGSLASLISYTTTYSGVYYIKALTYGGSYPNCNDQGGGPADCCYDITVTAAEEETTTTSDITTTTSDTTTTTALTTTTTSTPTSTASPYTTSTTASGTTTTTSGSTSTTMGTTSTTAGTTTTTATGCTCDAGCNGTTISLPFTKNGSGEYCWKTTDNLSTVNSWNTNKVEINNQDYTNIWSNSFPAKIDGKYYIYYKSSVSWGHFEAAGGGTTTTTAGTTTTAASGCTCDSGCNGSSISPNFTKDGAGQFCWRATSGNYINSWNMNKLTVNGVDFTGKYAFTSQLPAKINGKWYIYYDGSYPWSHFELKN